MPPMKYIHRDGRPVTEGHCVMPDHYTTTVQVTIRSQFPVNLETIRGLIQQRHEVIGIDRTDATCVVR